MSGSSSVVHAEVVVSTGAGGKPCFRVLRHSPLLALRPTPRGLYLVSPSATPLGGDRAALRLAVEPGASLVVRSAAASVAREGPVGSPSTIEVRATVGEEAQLVWLTEPTLLADRAVHESTTRLELAEGASLWWREAVVCGRSGEQGGKGRFRLALDRNCAPVVRQELRVGSDAPEVPSPAGLCSAKVLASMVATVRPGVCTPPPLTDASGSRVALLQTVDPAVVLVQATASQWRLLSVAWAPAMRWLATNCSKRLCPGCP